MAKTRENAKKITVWIPEEVYEWMAEEAKEYFSTLSAIAVMSLRASMTAHGRTVKPTPTVKEVVQGVVGGIRT